MRERCLLVLLGIFCPLGLGAAVHPIGDTPVVNEFMASNGSQAPLGEGELLDADGDSSDWIELYNPTPQTFDLGGWYLTDDPDNLAKWRFPSGIQIASNGFLLVFASGKNRTSGQLHTSFNLAAEGEYLALVMADGRTVAHEYGPNYPEQLSNVSYGLSQYNAQFVTSASDVSYHVPTAEDEGRDWTAVDFDDHGWQTGAASLGFSQASQVIGRDIGSVSMPGGLTPQGPAAFMVYGAGADIGGTADAFHYVFMPLRGDGELTARVIGMAITHAWAKAGVMIRETLTPGSRHAMEVITAGSGTAFQRRTATGGTSVSTHGNGYTTPHWVRIVRRGNTFSGYYSPDGVAWAQQGTEAISMAQDVYIGLCVTSHDPEQLCAAVFDNVTFGSQTNNLLRDQMLGQSASLWARIQFEAEETEFLDSLRLQLRYEDAFVAWLNGVEVARDNFTGVPRWNSVADRNRPDASMGVPMVVDLSDYRDLLREGHNVLAIHGLNDSREDQTFLVAPELTASGATMVAQYLATPTPGRANIAGAVDIVASPQVSHTRGLYDSPFVLSLSCDTPGATIRYTTDGKPPTETSGRLYTEPIPIRTTTCIQVAAFRLGWMPSGVQTYTYIFPDQVAHQPANPAGFPATWGATSADYEMDPDIVNAAARMQMTPALTSLPTMSIVMSVDDLFGGNGIYTNWNSSGDAWERPCSVELIHPDGREGFHVNCGIRIYGGVGRREAKKSFRLQFTRRYGPTRLRYPLFGDDAADEFDQLILRANFNDAYTWGGDRSQYIRDEYVRRMQLALGDPSPHGIFVHLYINGLYWGLYNPTERPEASFAATYFGGDKEDWDALNSGRVLGSGNAGTWNAMLSLVRQGMETQAAYQKLQGNNPDGTPNPNYVNYLDIDNYIDYMLLNFFVGNRDWPGHNWYAAMNRAEPGGWKSFSWDAEWVIGMNSGLTDNCTSVNNSLCEPYARLRTNPEFCLRFADIAHRAFAKGGPLYVDPANPLWDPARPERNRPAALYAELADQVELAMLGESARWGDVRGGSPYRIEQWRSQRDWVLNSYMPQRSAIVLDQLRSAGLYPTGDAPVFLINGIPHDGGQVPKNSQLGMTVGGRASVYYTTDGTDPRSPAFLPTDNKIVTLLREDAPKRVLVPSVANGGDRLSNVPSGFEVTFYKAKAAVNSTAEAEAVIANPALRTATVTEQARVINYFNTGSPGNFEGDRPFPGTVMNADVEDFVILVTGKVMIPQAGNWTFGVNSDDGFSLTLTSRGKTYTSAYPNPRSPADTLGVFNIAESGAHDLRLVFYERGGGSELELFAARGSFNSFSSSNFRLVGDVSQGGLQVGEGGVWFANPFDDSAWRLGTGGVGYEASTGNYPDYFSIDVRTEMHNVNGSCYIRIPFTVTGDTAFSNVMLKVRYDDGFIAYLNGAEVARRNFTGEPQWNSTASGTNDDGAAVAQATVDISEHAGLLWEGANLLAIHGLNASVGSSDFLFSVELVGGEISQGAVAPTAFEYTGPIPLTQSTHVKARGFNVRWSALNEAVFAVGPVAEGLRISEIMYHPLDTGHPDDPNTEYIELTNIGAESINLSLVRFTDGIDYTFPGFELPAGGYCLLVKDIAAFEAKYGADLPVLGQYAGNLDNAGERIELVDAAGQIIHRFEYDDDWYGLTDGLGFSLTVRDPQTADPAGLGDRGAWRPSAWLDGSPGADDRGDVLEPGSVVINELLANSTGSGPDWIELYNATVQSLDLGGWFLSDDADNLTKYAIAEGTSIAPGGYLVLYEDTHFGNADDPGCVEPFGLSKDGETLYLHSGSDGVLTGYSEEVRFEGSEVGISLGRWPNGTGPYHLVALREPTPGQANAEPLAVTDQ